MHHFIFHVKHYKFNFLDKFRNLGAKAQEKPVCFAAVHLLSVYQQFRHVISELQLDNVLIYTLVIC